jgi:PIN domain nuclease of toxin-antitoxin system
MIVIDTCIVIWLARDPEALSAAASAALSAARIGDGVAICDATLYELACLVRHGRVTMKRSLEALLDEVTRRFIVLPVTASVAQLAAAFPAPYPSDPMDRLIGATALDRGVPLITRDKAIRRSKLVPTIW